MAKRKKSSKNKTRKSPKRKAYFMRGFARLVVLAGLWSVLIGLGFLFWYGKDLAGITRGPILERRQSITFKAQDGSLIARYGEYKGDTIPVADLPPHLIRAVLAIEDRRFFSHAGIDPIGIGRAALSNLQAGHVVQGGSTITQQLAKNLFLSSERSFKRKIQEAMLAIWLEHQLTKDEILTAYLNQVYMGAGVYGMEAAAQTYFGKSATQVSLNEAATLAGILKAPSRYAPSSNPSLAKQRANVVLAAMEDAGYITRDEKTALASLPPKPKIKPVEGNSARYFTDWVADELDDLIGTPRQDIIVHTTLNPGIQNAASSRLSALITDNQSRAVSQGAVVVMSNDGAVKSMVGGKNYAASQFNRATQAKRQPGSAFKPFVYLAALESGWSPNDRVEDAPIVSGRYRPQNFDNDYKGMVPLHEALAFSLNTAAVRLAKDVGVGSVIEVARRAGIKSDLDYDLSLALGSSGLSMLELAGAYAVFANNGLRLEPYGILKIETADGTILYERPAKVFLPRAIHPERAEIMTAMLRGVVDYGTGRAARLSVQAAGKTGTSQNFRDAWFAGYTDDYTAVAWFGNDDNTPMKGVTGGSLPARLWKETMVAAYKERPAALDARFSNIHEKTGQFQNLLGRLLNSTPGQPAQGSYTLNR